MENVGTDLLQTTSSCTQDLVAYRYYGFTWFLEHNDTIGINTKNRYEVQRPKKIWKRSSHSLNCSKQGLTLEATQE